MGGRVASEHWMVDLDGVVWLGNEPIPGSADAIARLRASGRRVCFFTNNSFARRADLLGKFAAHGIECDDEDLFSSAEAAAVLVEPGERAFILGGGGIEEALTARGVEICREPEIAAGQSVDAVLVGLDVGLTFPRLTAATRAVLRGARLIGTNDDATYPMPDGFWPGGGAVLAAVAYSTGVTPIVAGKPYEPAAALARKRLGSVDVMVGDRPDTDGRFATRLQAKYALVRSGVTPKGAVVDDPTPDFDTADLAALADLVIRAPS
jgi:HAD superfamily hydrolase (TIGR01450 family)